MKMNMLRNFLLVAMLAVCLQGTAQTGVRKIKEVAATPVKNQAQSGTCWSFAAVSFLESELLRMGKGTHDLSEMFYVRLAYALKAQSYVHRQGHANFSPGGQAHDVMQLFARYGALPESSYSGNPTPEGHNHNELDAVLRAMVGVYARSESGSLTPLWKNAVEAVLDAYLGKLPEKIADGKSHVTPAQYASNLSLNPGDYIEITSFSHHPYYSWFVLEIPDNWTFSSYFNVTPDDMIRIMDYAIDNGYTLCWDGDVSDEKKFSSSVLADITDKKTAVDEKARQAAFDNFSVTDDHLMHITGYGEDAAGQRVYITKNSWGSEKGDGGYWYMSEKWIRLKTIAVMLHKKAIPDDILKKAGL
jgi:bleomycin hydrolase